MADLRKKPARIDLSIPCVADYVAVARLAISGVATRMDFSVEEIEDIKIAVSEACTNSVQYAYEESDTEARVDITCNLYDEKLEIVVSDTGKGFSVNDIEKNQGAKTENTLTTEKDEVPSLGLGITFIKSLMDEAEFTSAPGKGTVVRMAKLTNR